MFCLPRELFPRYSSTRILSAFVGVISVVISLHSLFCLILRILAAQILKKVIMQYAFSGSSNLNKYFPEHFVYNSCSSVRISYCFLYQYIWSEKMIVPSSLFLLTHLPTNIFPIFSCLIHEIDSPLSTVSFYQQYLVSSRWGYCPRVMLPERKYDFSYQSS